MSFGVFLTRGWLQKAEAENTGELSPSSKFTPGMYVLSFEMRVSESSPSYLRLRESTGVSAEHNVRCTHARESQGQVGSRANVHGHVLWAASQVFKGPASRLPGHRKRKADASWLHSGVTRQLKHQAKHGGSFLILLLLPSRGNMRI